MKRIQLLGASGSIGTQVLEIVEEFPEQFSLQAVTAKSSVKTVLEILSRHDVEMVSMAEEHEETIKRAYPDIKFYALEKGGLETIAASEDEAVVLNALVGSVGLAPTLRAIERNKDVLLANKETLVVGGSLIREALKASESSLIPIDSEHAALRECLRGSDVEDVEKLVITASGGSFRDLDKKALENVTKEDALKHPNWVMGAKITIDSATMMNKVFEIIEAHYLFDMPYENIEAVLHKESVVHGLVQFKDGNVLAHMGPSDMRIPILAALQGAKRMSFPTLFDLTSVGTLHFEAIDGERYSLFDLGLAVAKQGGLHVVTLNAANEVAVRLFLEDKISFLEIETLIKRALDHFQNDNHLTLDKIVEHDQRVREYIRNIVSR